MYRHYRDIPRIDDAAPMLARLRLQELHRQAAQDRLARSAAREPRDRLSLPVRTIWRALWIGMRKRPGGTGVGLPADRVTPAPET